MQKGTFVFNFLRETFSEATLQTVAVYFSRLTVVVKLLLGTILFCPLRWAAIGIMVMITGMVILSHVQLISVVGPLFVLMLGLLCLDRREPAVGAADLPQALSILTQSHEATKRLCVERQLEVPGNDN